jgi:hypothetical protein
MPTADQHEITTPSSLLDVHGRLNQVGWARQPVLDCNLEQANFYRWKALQHFRIKRWDYYGVTTPTHFYSFTLADLGYAGQAFAYVVDFERREYHEETCTIPLGRGLSLPRNSSLGMSSYENSKIRVRFQVEGSCRLLSVTWPGFWDKGLAAALRLRIPENQESLVIVIPIGVNRFYYNRKVNCIPANGWVDLGDKHHVLTPKDCLGNLDWGRGVWEYRSYWVWASASGYLPDRRTAGLNLGFGFGDTRAATENAIILDGHIHKLGQVDINYNTNDYMKPWKMVSSDGRLQLEFKPVLERVAKTNLLLISSNVHQIFGTYYGSFITLDGERVEIDGMAGFAEEHYARW